VKAVDGGLQQASGGHGALPTAGSVELRAGTVSVS
jgi:hypothetical protein